ncbi:E3 ubiquitin-protein ligase RDUF1 [Carica papaya]|uniref:E3 ubiquitin-protein ligase RDUF1 n=1 Tax=Carica papaya TaxID=3649 RepID=UPI000B8CF12D|nr:E3 ubiquitin-protein ligase RDUF1 [Carica papaya]
MSSPTSSTTSYWCYSCTRFVRAWPQDNGAYVSCPYCDGGFIEEIEAAPRSDDHGRRFPLRHDSHRSTDLGSRRSRRGAGDRSPFNPVVVLRGPSDGEDNTFELYYDDGSGSGLRPLPASISEFLMGSGFDRLLEQLAQIEVTGFGRPENPPASKAAIESMPRIEISDSHVGADLHCAICTEAFEMGVEAREMPCKHIYHGDCILPWLAMRNSCPVCRHELPTDSNLAEREEEETVGLTIWRLPGGGFAVGRFNGARREGERVLPVVFTEMDGGFGATGGPRRVSWVARRIGRRERTGGPGGLRRVVRGFVSFLRRLRSNRESPSRSIRGSLSESVSRSFSSNSSSVVGRYLRSGSNRASVLE